MSKGTDAQPNLGGANKGEINPPACVMGYDGNCQHVYTDKEGLSSIPLGTHIVAGAKVINPKGADKNPLVGGAKDYQDWKEVNRQPDWREANRQNPTPLPVKEDK